MVLRPTTQSLLMSALFESPRLKRPYTCAPKPSEIGPGPATQREDGKILAESHLGFRLPAELAVAAPGGDQPPHQPMHAGRGFGQLEAPHPWQKPLLRGGHPRRCRGQYKSRKEVAADA